MNAPAIKQQVTHLLSTTGLTTRAIARRVGCSKSYVDDLRALMGGGAAKPYVIDGDHEAHIARIAMANGGRGFPVCVRP